jgi:hypothetical protein
MESVQYIILLVIVAYVAGIYIGNWWRSNEYKNMGGEKRVKLGYFRRRLISKKLKRMNISIIDGGKGKQ